MGNIYSTDNIDFNKKVYCIIDLYLIPKLSDTNNFNIYEYKEDIGLKNYIKDIIIRIIENKTKRKIFISQDNLLLVCKKDSNENKYLEVNVSIGFKSVDESVKINYQLPIMSNTPTYIDTHQIIDSNKINLFNISFTIRDAFYQDVINNVGILTSNKVLKLSTENILTVKLFQK
jgi:hypothetical protein